MFSFCNYFRFPKSFPNHVQTVPRGSGFFDVVEINMLFLIGSLGKQAGHFSRKASGAFFLFNHSNIYPYRLIGT